MDEKVELLNEIFEAELTMDDLEQNVEDVLLWDSFHIMDFMAEMAEHFQKRITLEQISEIKRIRELLRFMETE